MGFDLLLAGGTGNTLFSEELLGCLVEARVEQSLDDPTKFAVRFLDDLEDGALIKPRLPELQVGEMITIVVSGGAGYRCLARGPILEHRSEITRGGPGSWFEVHGLDRRDELDREYREGSWAGRASDVATLLLSPVYPGADVARTEQIYDFEGQDLPQRGSDLEFLNKHASENGFHFWVTYENVAEAPPGNILLREVAHWKASPDLQDALPGVLPPLPLADDAITLRYNVAPGECSNVTRFELDADGNAPSQVRASTTNTSDGAQDPVTVQDQAAPMGGQGEGLSSQAPVRFMAPRPQGDAQTARTINEAALREAGFFVKAEISTTRYLLTDVLEPHQIVGVEGIGGANGATPFRVAEVVHVINGIAHMIDAKLETNVQIPQ